MLVGIEVTLDEVDLNAKKKQLSFEHALEKERLFLRQDLQTGNVQCTSIGGSSFCEFIIEFIQWILISIQY